MTKLFISFALQVMICSGAWAQSDSLAILKLLDDEMNTYASKSMAETVQQYWLLDELTAAIISLPDGTCFRMNREAMLANTAAPPPSTVQITRTNVRMQIKGDQAFVSYEQVLTNKGMDMVSRSYELVILKKVAGAWKKHYFSGHYLK